MTALKCKKATKPGMYGDGDGLFYGVAWRFQVSGPAGHGPGKATDIGLGGFPAVSLPEARDAAIDNRRVARAGGDPLAAKRGAVAPTFREAAEKTCEARRPRWRNDKTEKYGRAFLPSTLTRHREQAG